MFKLLMTGVLIELQKWYKFLNLKDMSQFLILKNNHVVHKYGIK